MDERVATATETATATDTATTVEAFFTLLVVGRLNEEGELW